MNPFFSVDLLLSEFTGFLNFKKQAYWLLEVLSVRPRVGRSSLEYPNLSSRVFTKTVNFDYNRTKMMDIRSPCHVTFYWGYYIVLWLFHLVCGLYCGCFNLFVMCACVCVFFVMCGCFGNVYLYLLCFVLFVLCFCIVSFMYIYSYLFCVYWRKDYCNRVTTYFQ